jgi:hypothetical protein
MGTLDTPPTALEPANERLQKTMALVLLATLSGVLTLLWFYGWGIVVNWLLAGAMALAVEATVLTLRRQQAMPALSDGSALVALPTSSGSISAQWRHPTPGHRPSAFILLGMLLAAKNFWTDRSHRRRSSDTER